MNPYLALSTTSVSQVGKVSAMFWAVFVALLLPLLAIAKGNEFGGGFIVERPAGAVLFDFLEYGIDSPSLRQYPDHKNYASYFVESDLPIDLQEKVVWKLNEVALVAPEFADHIADLFKSFSWRFVKLELKRIEDVGPSDYDLKSVVLNPIALRETDQRTIFISKPEFNKLNHIHQIGLLFHEILGAYFELSVLESENGYPIDPIEFPITDSSKSRRINAEIFKPNLNFDGLRDAFIKSKHLRYQKMTWNLPEFDIEQVVWSRDIYVYQSRSEYKNNIATCAKFVQNAKSIFSNYHLKAIQFNQVAYSFYKNLHLQTTSPVVRRFQKTNYIQPYIFVPSKPGDDMIFTVGISWQRYPVERFVYTYPIEAVSRYKICSSWYVCDNPEIIEIVWQNYFDFNSLESVKKQLLDTIISFQKDGRNKCDWSNDPNYPAEYVRLHEANKNEGWE